MFPLKIDGYRPVEARRATHTKLNGLVVALMLASLVALLFTAGPGAVRAADVDNRVLVQLQSGFSPDSLNLTYGTTTAQVLTDPNTYLLNPMPGQTADAQVALMSRDTRLVFAETNYKASQMQTMQIYFTFDPASALTNGQSNPLSVQIAQNQPAYGQIRLAQAQTISRGAGVVVAVIDSGINAAHPELAGKILPGRNILSGTSDTTDQLGHGTFIAGVISQIAPDARILPVKVVGNSSYGRIEDAIAGIRWAADNGANIISISLGTYYGSKDFDDVLKYARDTKGALIFASAGNNNSNLLRYPAAESRVSSIAALDNSNRKASFSNYSNTVDLDAPGVGIYSTYYLGGYAYGDGTSFSTPIAAGVAALTWAKQRTLKSGDVLKKLQDTAVKLDSCNPAYKNTLGHGLVDSYRAVGGPALSKVQMQTYTCQPSAK